MTRVVPIIVGPTAVGKTGLSLILAEQCGAEIISADSRQIFKYMDIGTAKVSAKDQKRVPHYFIDICTPDQDYSAGRFATEARKVIDDLLAQRKQPIVVGGSGFYIMALVDGIVELDLQDEEVRERLTLRLQKEGLAELYRELCRVDPPYAAKISPNDRQRILRSLEVWYLTGKPFSSWHDQQAEPAGFRPLFFGLTMERNKLYQRINQRVDEMLSRGLITEVEDLLQRGYSPELNALNTVGYKEVIDYLHHRISYEEMAELIKRNSRRYAKRQLTWFRRDQRIEWLDISSNRIEDNLVDRVLQKLKKVSNRSTGSTS